MNQSKKRILIGFTIFFIGGIFGFKASDIAANIKEKKYSSNNKIGYKSLRLGDSLEEAKKIFEFKGCHSQQMGLCELNDQNSTVWVMINPDEIIYHIGVDSYFSIPPTQLIAELTSKYGKPSSYSDSQAHWCIDDMCLKSISFSSKEIGTKKEIMDELIRRGVKTDPIGDNNHKKIIKVAVYYSDQMLTKDYFNKSLRAMKDY